jgi:hypothetical protein
MRNKALSVLRAQQLIIHNATQTINCFDVNTHNFGFTPGGAPGVLVEKAETVETASLSILDRLV